MAAYTTIDDPEAYFQTKLYTGNATSDTSITLDGDTDMQPDLVWIKERNSTSNNEINDAVRGATKWILSDSNSAEGTEAEGLTAFNSDGFTLGDNGAYNQSSSYTYVAWCWKANGAGSSNSSGDLTVTTSANTTAGFSIVKGTSDSTASRTIGHGLGTVPDAIISKNLDATYNWDCFFKTLGYNASLQLNQDAVPRTGAWTDNFTTTLFQTINGYTSNNGDEYVYYCFSNRQGFSKFGSHEGNANANGPFVFCGFRPAFVMLKNIDTAEGWNVYDNKRNGFNVVDKYVQANTTAAEESGNNEIDFLSNGFKLRSANTGSNRADTHVYAAFAEAPLVNSNGVPGNAR